MLFKRGSIAVFAIFSIVSTGIRFNIYAESGPQTNESREEIFTCCLASMTRSGESEAVRNSLRPITFRARRFCHSDLRRLFWASQRCRQVYFDQQ